MEGRGVPVGASLQFRGWGLNGKTLATPADSLPDRRAATTAPVAEASSPVTVGGDAAVLRDTLDRQPPPK